MNRFQAAIFLYAVLNIAMGIHGYIGAHSLPSIIAGCSIGIIEIFFATLSKENPRVGFIGAAVVALLTAAQWVPKLEDKTGALSVYPALVGLVISLALAAYLVGGHLAARAKARRPSIDPQA